MLPEGCRCGFEMQDYFAQHYCESHFGSGSSNIKQPLCLAPSPHFSGEEYPEQKKAEASQKSGCQTTYNQIMATIKDNMKNLDENTERLEDIRKRLVAWSQRQDECILRN
ncbi:hypothetical protein DM02DRAFT_665533 [Periconia macrospinosa]|uniref:Uncharacterized protein n=1 Tax=Periconia macrospinosa TaxID=97972 RepID=A0A2V1CWJ2_9PLEO|nr:hypothetical protein DM02DRAFT_665533 [Periconia macrospinosa]